MSASADVLAQAKVEIDLNAIPEGKNVCTAPDHDAFIRSKYLPLLPLFLECLALPSHSC